VNSYVDHLRNLRPTNMLRKQVTGYRLYLLQVITAIESNLATKKCIADSVL